MAEFKPKMMWQYPYPPNQQPSEEQMAHIYSHQPPPYFYPMMEGAIKNQKTDKWYYLTIILVISFVLQQTWNFYQTRLKTEKRIHKMQQYLVKRKSNQSKADLGQQKMDNSVENLKTSDKKLKRINSNLRLSIATATPKRSESNIGFERESKVKDQIGDLVKKTNTSIPFEKPVQARDDVSIFSISRKSSYLEDPMVASAKEREAINQSKFPITRICITGGPCAGKTTALATLSLHLKQIGYRVLLVPEAATILMKGGALIQTPTMGIASQVKFQISLMKLQMNLEDIFVDIAQSSETPTIILCDRGVMDGSAYTDDNVWQAILDETGWSTIQLRDRRYEAVIHMVTAADGAEKFYTKENNEARYESVEQAVDLDKRLINAWVGHPHFSIIQNNSRSFQDKVDQCLSTVLNFIGLPSPSAYVKKFLLIVDKSYHDFKIPKSIKKEFFEVHETFLQVQNLGFTDEEATNLVRKIGKNDSFIYSQEINYMQNQEKILKKRQITAREYIELLEMRDTSKRQLRKIRQCFIYMSQYFMLESFGNVDGQPSLLRIETTGEKQNLSIPPFLKILREVTNDPRYVTKTMAEVNYRMPDEDKEEILESINTDKMQQMQIVKE